MPKFFFGVSKVYICTLPPCNTLVQNFLHAENLELKNPENKQISQKIALFSCRRSQTGCLSEGYQKCCRVIDLYTCTLSVYNGLLVRRLTEAKSRLEKFEKQTKLAKMC